MGGLPILVLSYPEYADPVEPGGAKGWSLGSFKLLLAMMVASGDAGSVVGSSPLIENGSTGGAEAINVESSLLDAAPGTGSAPLGVSGCPH